MLSVTHIYHKGIVLQPSVLFTQLTVTHNTTHTRSALSCAPRNSAPQCHVIRTLPNFLTFRFFLMVDLRHRRLHLDGNFDVCTKWAA